MNAKLPGTQKAWTDPDDAPELTDEFFERGKRHIGTQPVSREAYVQAVRAPRRGRPVGTTKADAKVSITIRFDADVLAALRATGPGWQTRVNEVLRALFVTHPA